MALIKFGGGVVSMSGSIAGNTFARNRYGNYVRSRTKPVNPNTARQQAVRSALTFLTERWSQTLTAAQRTAWNLYAASVTMTNKLGESINLSGFNHYLRSNATLKRLSLPLVDAGPTTFELPEVDPTLSFTASEASGDLTVAYDDTMAWCDEDEAFMFIYQGSPQNAQCNFFGGPWRYADKVEGDQASPPSTPATVAGVFAITELQKQWIYARIQRADGRISEPFRANAFIGA